MPNYYGNGRSNYVRLKDENDLDKVKEIASYYELSVSPCDTNPGEFCFLGTSDDGDINGYHYGDEDDETEHQNMISLGVITADATPGENELIPFEEVMCKYLHPEDVFIWIHAGNEKLRYITGSAFAFNAEGKSVCVNLTDIYELAKPLGKRITVAEY